MLYRCYNPRCQDKPHRIGHDFTAAEAGKPGKCDKCGVTETDPQFGRFVVPLVTVHLMPVSEVNPHVGSGVLACGFVHPSGKPQRFSGEAAAVNCPACMASAAFAKARAEQDGQLHPDYDVNFEQVAKVNPAEENTAVTVLGGTLGGGK